MFFVSAIQVEDCPIGVNPSGQGTGPACQHLPCPSQPLVLVVRGHQSLQAPPQPGQACLRKPATNRAAAHCVGSRHLLPKTSHSHFLASSLAEYQLRNGLRHFWGGGLLSSALRSPRHVLSFFSLPKARRTVSFETPSDPAPLVTMDATSAKERPCEA